MVWQPAAALANEEPFVGVVVLTREEPVRYVRTTFLPDDETCFHVFEAAAEEAVREICRRAGIDSARIVPAVE